MEDDDNAEDVVINVILNQIATRSFKSSRQEGV